MIKAMVHSLNALAEVEILVQQSNNLILARYRGDVCTAIYDQFTGLYYVDDVYGKLDKKETAGAATYLDKIYNSLYEQVFESAF